MNSSSGAAGGGYLCIGGPRAEYFELTRIMSRNLEAGRAMQNMLRKLPGFWRLRIITACLADDFDMNQSPVRNISSDYYRVCRLICRFNAESAYEAKPISMAWIGMTDNRSANRRFAACAAASGAWPLVPHSTR
ncbi:UNVERIFIED_ORG: hypothetical protein J2791_000858 [Burkholderia contaminans]|nr:hypothetical protein [Burkholderia contaminans]